MLLNILQSTAQAPAQNVKKFCYWETWTKWRQIQIAIELTRDWVAFTSCLPSSSPKIPKHCHLSSCTHRHTYIHIEMLTREWPPPKSTLHLLRLIIFTSFKKQCLPLPQPTHSITTWGLNSIVMMFKIESGYCSNRYWLI